MIILNKRKDVIPKEAIYVGRGSPYGNIFVIGQDGTRDEVIDKYEVLVRQAIINKDPTILEAFKKLNKDSILLCYCRPHRCHAEVIEKLWNEYFNNNNIPSPSKDGIDHINIYSKGRTELGKLLSNFTHSPFEHKMYGKFNTVEGFWHWLKTDKQYDIFRECSGAEAKSMSKNYSFVFNGDFKSEIKKAILLKIEQNEKIKQLLKDSTLPLTHYYYYGTVENGKVVIPDNSKWVVDYIELIREYLNNKAYKLIIAGSREITSYETVKKAYIDSDLKAIEIVSGTARGVDRLGEQLAKELELPVERFSADWDTQPKIAGFLRNEKMSIYATGLLAVWDGKSTGTQDMIERMKKKNKLVTVSS